jgi:hypothetical protein
MVVVWQEESARHKGIVNPPQRIVTNTITFFKESYTL